MTKYQGHKDAVWQAAWSPDGKRVVSVSNDQTIQVWDAASGKLIWKAQGQGIFVLAVAWSRNGKYIAAANADTDTAKDVVQILDAATGKEAFLYKGYGAPVRAGAWSPDSKQVASSGDTGDVTTWDALTGGSSGRYASEDEQGRCYSVAWSPDGTHLAAANENGKAYAWSLAGGSTLYSYLGHAPLPVLAVDWSPDSKYVVSGGGDQTVQIWQPK